MCAGGNIEKTKFVTEWDTFNASLELMVYTMVSRGKGSYKKCTQIVKRAYIRSSILGLLREENGIVLVESNNSGKNSMVSCR